MQYFKSKRELFFGLNACLLSAALLLLSSLAFPHMAYAQTNGCQVELQGIRYRPNGNGDGEQLHFVTLGNLPETTSYS